MSCKHISRQLISKGVIYRVEIAHFREGQEVLSWCGDCGALRVLTWIENELTQVDAPITFEPVWLLPTGRNG